MVASAVQTRSGRLPGGRHGAGQNHPGVIIALNPPTEEKGMKLPPCLLVAPASLLANWAAEIEQFAPDLRARILHPSVMTAEEVKQFKPEQTAELDLAITSYGTLLRMPALAATTWRLVILDEAQAIKNPNAKQTRAAKMLQARARIALTGTPVENSLSDLWSIFDFINPGLLGGAKPFAKYVKTSGRKADNPYGPLRELVRPYILRRMKTDRSVIVDLPDKTEIKALLPPQPQTGGSLFAGSRGSRPELRRGRWNPAQGSRAHDVDAPQANL